MVIFYIVTFFAGTSYQVLWKTEALRWNTLWITTGQKGGKNYILASFARRWGWCILWRRQESSVGCSYEGSHDRDCFKNVLRGFSWCSLDSLNRKYFLSQETTLFIGFVLFPLISLLLFLGHMLACLLACFSIMSVVSLPPPPLCSRNSCQVLGLKCCFFPQSFLTVSYRSF